MRIEPLIFSRLLGLNFADKVEEFRRRLPGVLERALREWQLEIEAWADHGDYSAVAFCRQGEAPCVLKVPLDPQLVAVEASAFAHWDGQGAVRLLAAGEEALLLERAEPGVQLAALPEPARARGAAEALKALHARPARTGALSLAEHLTGQHRLFAELVGDWASEPQYDLLQALVARLLASAPAPALLHGDPHSRNLLTSARGYLAIDPLPMAGDGGYDLAYWALIDQQRNRGQGAAERLDLVALAYGYPRTRLEAWAYVVACGKLVNAHFSQSAQARRPPMAAYLEAREEPARQALDELAAPTP